MIHKTRREKIKRGGKKEKLKNKEVKNKKKGETEDKNTKRWGGQLKNRTKDL